MLPSDPQNGWSDFWSEGDFLISRRWGFICEQYLSHVSALLCVVWGKGQISEVLVQVKYPQIIKQFIKTNFIAWGFVYRVSIALIIGVLQEFVLFFWPGFSLVWFNISQMCNKLGRVTLVACCEVFNFGLHLCWKGSKQMGKNLL